MKKTIWIALIFFLGFKGFAQPLDLKGTWYVQSLTINGSTYNVPQNVELTYVESFFSPIRFYHSLCCAGGMTIDVTYDSTQPFFEITDISPYPETCDDTGNNDFSDIYFDFFVDGVNGVFTYDVTTDTNGYKTLTITNDNGDEALFSSDKSLPPVPPGFIPSGQTFDTWYLHNMIIDSQDNFPYPYDDFEYIYILFDTDGYFQTVVCASMEGFIVFNQGDSEFYFACDSVALELTECGQEEDNAYQGLYMTFFWDFYESKVFTYEVEPDGNMQILTITDPYGDKAVFGSEPALSTESFGNTGFSVYPNPVNDLLYIESPGGDATGLSISVYDIYGRSVLSKTIGTASTINVKNIRSGIYFLSIESKNGQRQVSKFVKR